MLFELVCGHHPFFHADIATMLDRLRTHSPVEDLPDDLHPDLRAMISSLVAKDPAARPDADKLIGLKILKDIAAIPRSLLAPFAPWVPYTTHRNEVDATIVKIRTQERQKAEAILEDLQADYDQGVGLGSILREAGGSHEIIYDVIFMLFSCSSLSGNCQVIWIDHSLAFIIPTTTTTTTESLVTAAVEILAISVYNPLSAVQHPPKYKMRASFGLFYGKVSPCY